MYQDVLGFSAQAFGLLFAVNGIGLLATNIINARLVRSTPPERLLRAGLGTIAGSGLLTAAGGRVQHGTDHVQLGRGLDGARKPPRRSAAALFGASQFIIGAAVAPIVGAAGASAVPMGIVMATSGVAAMVIGRTITRARG